MGGGGATTDTHAQHTNDTAQFSATMGRICSLLTTAPLLRWMRLLSKSGTAAHASASSTSRARQLWPQASSAGCRCRLRVNLLCTGGGLPLLLPRLPLLLLLLPALLKRIAEAALGQGRKAGQQEVCAPSCPSRGSLSARPGAIGHLDVQRRRGVLRWPCVQCCPFADTAAALTQRWHT